MKFRYYLVIWLLALASVEPLFAQDDNEVIEDDEDRPVVIATSDKTENIGAGPVGEKTKKPSVAHDAKQTEAPAQTKNEAVEPGTLAPFLLKNNNTKPKVGNTAAPEAAIVTPDNNGEKKESAEKNPLSQSLSQTDASGAISSTIDPKIVSNKRKDPRKKPKDGNEVEGGAISSTGTPAPPEKLASSLPSTVSPASPVSSQPDVSGTAEVKEHKHSTDANVASSVTPNKEDDSTKDAKVSKQVSTDPATRTVTPNKEDDAPKTSSVANKPSDNAATSASEAETKTPPSPKDKGDTPGSLSTKDGKENTPESPNENKNNAPEASSVVPLKSTTPVPLQTSTEKDSIKPGVQVGDGENANEEESALPTPPANSENNVGQGQGASPTPAAVFNDESAEEDNPPKMDDDDHDRSNQEEEEKKKEPEISPTRDTLSSKDEQVPTRYEEEDTGNTRFFIFLIIVVGGVLLVYMAYVNRAKLMAIVVEGWSGRGGSSRRQSSGTSSSRNGYQYQPLATRPASDPARRPLASGEDDDDDDTTAIVMAAPNNGSNGSGRHSPATNDAVIVVDKQTLQAVKNYVY